MIWVCANPRTLPGGPDLLALYDRTLPEVYGYLRARVGTTALAEDLTSETFLAAVDALRRGRGDQLSGAWLMTVARNKLVDHWRRREREERSLHLAHDHDVVVEPWDAHLDAAHAREVLATLAVEHRAALTLCYLDGLPVVQVADLLGRTLHATEALLVRTRAAFRRAYGDGRPE
ncbi:MAG: sigma-70 family RNA polymerase sigma factor [Actinobacteria bacterium]|nr:sigma-70 family RNA polymerase sigma factor [Actinomycetota bacterium]